MIVCSIVYQFNINARWLAMTVLTAAGCAWCWCVAVQAGMAVGWAGTPMMVDEWWFYLDARAKMAWAPYTRAGGLVGALVRFLFRHALVNDNGIGRWYDGGPCLFWCWICGNNWLNPLPAVAVMMTSKRLSSIFREGEVSLTVLSCLVKPGRCAGVAHHLLNRRRRR